MVAISCIWRVVLRAPGWARTCISVRRACGRRRCVLPASLALVVLASATARAGAPRPASFERARQQMVAQEIEAAGVHNRRVLDAMRATPRHAFVGRSQRAYAYYDMALPIGEGQTISPPFIVAYMTEQLDPQPDDRVLEIGTGSGYQAAVLSQLVRDVYTIEIVPSLGRRAARTLKRLGYANVHVKIGDGYQGWPAFAPFDKIIVTCSPEKVPPALVDQLQPGGLLIVPVGERYQQSLYLFTKRDGRLESKALLPTLFVPMTGAAEAARQRQPDPLHPSIENGGFEVPLDDADLPAGWHYTRRLTRADRAADAPEGHYVAHFANDVPGRMSQALQGFAVDGRQVDQLDVSCYVRAEGIGRGQDRHQWAALVILFYDTNRKQIGQASLGPWRGTFDWRQQRQSVAVPLAAREAILRVGLLGAVGTLDVDAIRVGRSPSQQ